jgi:hypothetical protein
MKGLANKTELLMIIHLQSILIAKFIMEILLHSLCLNLLDLLQHPK